MTRGRCDIPGSAREGAGRCACGTASLDSESRQRVTALSSATEYAHKSSILILVALAREYDYARDHRTSTRSFTDHSAARACAPFKLDFKRFLPDRVACQEKSYQSPRGPLVLPDWTGLRTVDRTGLDCQTGLPVWIASMYRLATARCTAHTELPTMLCTNGA